MSPTTTSKSIFSRILSYITSWFTFLFETIYSLYKDELERQSRDENDYNKWKLYEEVQKTQQTQQFDEESILGEVSFSPSSRKSPTIKKNLSSEASMVDAARILSTSSAENNVNTTIPTSEVLSLPTVSQLPNNNLVSNSNVKEEEIVALAPLEEPKPVTKDLITPKSEKDNK